MKRTQRTIETVCYTFVWICVAIWFSDGAIEELCLARAGGGGEWERKVINKFSKYKLRLSKMDLERFRRELVHSTLARYIRNSTHTHTHTYSDTPLQMDGKSNWCVLDRKNKQGQKQAQKLLSVHFLEEDSIKNQPTNTNFRRNSVRA